jgi:hypothetical protein
VAVRSGNHFLVDAQAAVAKEVRVVVAPQAGRSIALDEIEWCRTRPQPEPLA